MDQSQLPVIVNRSGGTASRAGETLADDLVQAFAAAGRSIVPDLVNGADLADVLERHAAAPRMVIGGGDGTVGTAAAFAASHGIELAVLPLGTRNHFARQLDVPLDLEGAAALAASGTPIAVDLGECGGKTFVNNASAGAYVDLVREREHSSLPKWLASIVAAFRILMHLRPRRFLLRLDGERREIVTPMLFVGNNRYEIAEGHPGERDSLTDGCLSVFALAPLGLFALLGIAVRTLFGRPDMRKDFVLDATAGELVVEGPGDTIEIALDGERERLALPLTLRVRPGALKVVGGAAAHG